MPIEPVDPSKKTGGDGTEKYSPNEKRGPGKFDEILEKAEKAQKARDEISKIAGEQREKVKAESPRTYTERLQDMGRLPKPSGGGGGTGIGGKLGNRDLNRNGRAGGKVSASSRADGIAIRGKTKGRTV
jgi:hypothetical protein